MITDLGHISVVFTLVASVYAAVISHIGVQRNDERLVQSGWAAAMTTFPLILIGAVGV